MDRDMRCIEVSIGKIVYYVFFFDLVIVVDKTCWVFYYKINVFCNLVIWATLIFFIWAWHIVRIVCVGK